MCENDFEVCPVLLPEEGTFQMSYLFYLNVISVGITLELPSQFCQGRMSPEKPVEVGPSVEPLCGVSLGKCIFSCVRRNWLISESTNVPWFTIT